MGTQWHWSGSAVVAWWRRGWSAVGVQWKRLCGSLVAVRWRPFVGLHRGCQGSCVCSNYECVTETPCGLPLVYARRRVVVGGHEGTGIGGDVSGLYLCV